MDPERVQAFVGDRHQFPGIDNLRHIARVGVPVDVRPGGDVTKEPTYGIIQEHRNFTSQCGKRRLQTL